MTLFFGLSLSLSLSLFLAQAKFQPVVNINSKVSAVLIFISLPRRSLSAVTLVWGEAGHLPPPRPIVVAERSCLAPEPSHPAAPDAGGKPAHEFSSHCSRSAAKLGGLAVPRISIG